MLVIGLTGGIGSGKTAVSDKFAELGVPVIDTDQIARELVEPKQPALQAIIDRFGATCLNPDSSLNRAHLRRLIFNDPAAKKDLEAILHPRIRAEVKRRLAELSAPYCILVIPLLVETGDAYSVDRILLVDVPEEVQIARVMVRDGINHEQAARILSAQATRSERISKADDIIENSGPLIHTQQLVEQWHDYYMSFADDD